MKTNNALQNVSKNTALKPLVIAVIDQQLPLKNVFRISRGAKTHANVVIVSINDGVNVAWAEAVPYARYQESIELVKEQITNFANQSLNTANIEGCIGALLPGAASNALDCAWWDLKAKQQNTTVAHLLQLSPAAPCITAQTLSIDTPKAMAKAVTALNNPPLVKVKLDNQKIVEKMTAIQRAAPNSELILQPSLASTINSLLGADRYSACSPQ